MHFLGFPQERALLLTTTVPPHPLYTASSPALNLVKKKKTKNTTGSFMATAESLSFLVYQSLLWKQRETCAHAEEEL